VLVVGCGSDDALPPESPSACEPPLVPAADGSCVAAGLQPNGCAAGETLALDGSCQPAGLTAAWCAEGFTFDPAASSCEPILSPKCDSGMMALPGEATCRPVMPCPDEPWGGIPVDPTTQYVDAGYADGDGDGSQAKPWPTINEALGAALTGSLIAIEAGTYDEVLDLVTPVRLWGICPEKVQLVPPNSNLVAVTVRPAGNGSEIHGIGIDGGLAGVVTSGAEPLIVDRVWIRNASDRAIGGEDTLGFTVLEVRDSLLEANVRGIVSLGAQLLVERVEIRDAAASADATAGRGIEVTFNINTGFAPEAAIVGSRIERMSDAAVIALGASVSVSGVVVQDTQIRSDGRGGRAIAARSFENGPRAALTVSSSLLASSQGDGLHIQGSDAVVEGVVIRDNQQVASDEASGRGVNLVDGDDPGQRATLTLRHALIERNHEVGVFAGGSDLVAEGVLVQDTQPRLLHDLRAGYGVTAYSDGATGERSTLALTGCHIRDNTDFGVNVLGSDAVLTGVLVTGTLPRASDGVFGDGAVVVAEDPSFPASAVIIGSRFERNTRAGVAVFGAAVSLQSSLMSCQPLDLAAEIINDIAPSLTDGGENVCGCEQAAACKAVSSGILPPQML
jgi:hypothetical protein